MVGNKKATARGTKRTATPARAKSARKKATRKKATKPRKPAEPKAPVWIEPFLEALLQTRSVSHACDAISLGRTTVYQHRDKDDDFRRRWDEARWAFRDDLETSTLEWAIDGHPEPVFGRIEERNNKGVITSVRIGVVGVKKTKSAAVSLRMLECLAPEKYGRDQGESDPHEAARQIREDLAMMVGGVPTEPPAGVEPNLVEPVDPSMTPRPPGQARRVGATGHAIPATKRRAKRHEPEPPP